MEKPPFQAELNAFLLSCNCASSSLEGKNHSPAAAVLVKYLLATSAALPGVEHFARIFAVLAFPLPISTPVPTLEQVHGAAVSGLQVEGAVPLAIAASRYKHFVLHADPVEVKADVAT